MLEQCHPVIRCTVNFFRWVPVVFITALLVWSYYAYTVELCVFTVRNIYEKLVYILFFNVVFCLLVWSYWRTMFTALHKVPEQYRLSAEKLDEFLRASKAGQNEILDRLAANLPILTRSYTEGVRYCAKCVLLKPDRTHHCGVCGVCLLKMDHHCPWVNACIHWGNYKYFVLFLGYSLLFCLYVFFTDLQYFVWSWRQDPDEGGEPGGGGGGNGGHRPKARFHVMFLFFVSGMFAISVGCLFFYHLYLTAKNRSTIEACYAPTFRYGPDKNGYNLGVARNFREVFGPASLRALVPVPTSPGDGAAFPTRRAIQDCAPGGGAHRPSLPIGGVGAYKTMGSLDDRPASGGGGVSERRSDSLSGGGGGSRVYRGPSAENAVANPVSSSAGRGKYVLMRQCPTNDFYKYDDDYCNFSSQDEI